ncbi:MAG: helix-turn-helix transcriptional regulator, partial [Rikenellaceae bacterium]
MNSRPIPLIIVLTPNTLSSIGLRDMLNQILPFALVKVFDTVEQLTQIEPADIFHLFVSSQILVENVALFEPLHSKCIALTNGSANVAALQEFPQINIQQSEEQILASIKALHSHAHGGRPANSHGEDGDKQADLLSPREIEVAKLLVEGLINKEIASELNIGLTTVITHRKNIFEKLGIKSIA